MKALIETKIRDCNKIIFKWKLNFTKAGFKPFINEKDVEGLFFTQTRQLVNGSWTRRTRYQRHLRIVLSESGYIKFIYWIETEDDAFLNDLNNVCKNIDYKALEIEEPVVSGFLDFEKIHKIKF